MYYYYKIIKCDFTEGWTWKIYYYNEYKEEIIYTKSTIIHPSEKQSRFSLLQWLFESKLVAIEDN